MANRNNYAAKLELKKQNKTAAGLISEQFPQVAGMVIQMTYYQDRANPLLMVRTVNVFPTSSAYFKMDCMTKGCEDGGFDLSPVVRGMIKEKKKGKKGRIECRGKSGAVTAGHASVEYDISIRYVKSSR